MIGTSMRDPARDDVAPSVRDVDAWKKKGKYEEGRRGGRRRRAGSLAPTDRGSGYAQVGIRGGQADVYLSGDPGFHVLRLDGRLESKRAHVAVDFDKLDDFDLHISTGEIMVSCDVLQTRFNRYIFAYPGAHLADAKTSCDSSRQLEITGRANPFGLPPRPSVPFTPPRSFVWLQSGDLKFHNLTLLNTRRSSGRRRFRMRSRLRSCSRSRSRWASIEASLHRAPRRYRPTARSK
ncbi:hypothetical protein [Burkholderia oklahomensis]|uniref:hypothetical protein n=1 Tax=Burkholderia oklahomensis TaxID=342113 RepID=UPI002658A7BB|nr:hypothetical protein [Burkholderia oklahomensis]